MTPASPSAATRRTRTRVFATLALLLVAAVVTGIAYVTQILNRDRIPLGAPSGELGLVSNRDGTWDIFILDADGVLTNLTDDDEPDADEYFASWHFGGDMVNFLTDRSGEMGPGQVAPDGSDFAVLSILQGVMQTFAAGRLDWDPVWSPDAAQVAWASLRDLNLEVYTMDLPDETNITRYTEDGLNGPRDWFIAWSPDGESLLYSTDRNDTTGSNNEDVYLLDLATGETTRLTTDPANDFHPMWTLDGEQIVFVTERNVELVDGQVEFYVMNPNGSDIRPLDESQTWRIDPHWSADGSQVVYASNEDGPWHLFIMDADGENIRRLTEGDADFLFPVWRPLRADSSESAEE